MVEPGDKGTEAVVLFRKPKMEKWNCMAYEAAQYLSTPLDILLKELKDKGHFENHKYRVEPRPDEIL